MAENWKDIAGYEGRYQVSDLGRVKSLPFPQRYLLRNGKEAFRQTQERVLATQQINSGYAIVHLHLNGIRSARLVHRLVVYAFLSTEHDETINHRNGDKLDNRVQNLEWVSYTSNHLHAVEHRLNKQAVPVIDPHTGLRFPSINQAAKALGHSPRTVCSKFLRCDT